MKLDIQINRIYPHDMHFGVFYVEGTADVHWTADEGDDVAPRSGVIYSTIKIPVLNTEENRKRYHLGAKVLITYQ